MPGDGLLQRQQTACPAWRYSNGNGVNVGTPEIGVYGPELGQPAGGGIGVTTGPLLPGQSWTSNNGVG